MPGLKFFSDTPWLSGTWTASSQASGLPVSNLNRPSRQLPWRSTGIGTQWVQLDMLTAYPVGGIAVVNANTTLNALLRINASANGVDFTWITDLVPWATTLTGTLVVWLSSPQTYRYWGLLIEDNGNSDGYYEIGKVCFGPAFDLGQPPGTEVSVKTVDPSPVSWAPSGTPYTYELDPYTVLEVPTGRMQRSKAFADLWPALRLLGTRRDTVLSLYPEDPGADGWTRLLTLYGRFTSLPTVQYHAGQVERWSGALSFRESR